MGEGALRQDEVDNLLEKKSVKLKAYVLKEIRLLRYDNEEDEYFIKGLAALIKSKSCKKHHKKKTEK